MFETLRLALKNYLDDAAISEVERAFRYAAHAHKGQFRSSGEPYITHPVAAAKILADWRMDVPTLCAALMHDVLEDTSVEKKRMAEEFGEKITELVDGTSKLTQMEFQSKAMAQAENVQKVVMAMSKDVRVILIKLADRLHNMRTLSSLPSEKRHRISKETLEIYAPIAYRLGILDLYHELSELSFVNLYPIRNKIIENRMKEFEKNILHWADAFEKQLKAQTLEKKIKANISFSLLPVYDVHQKIRLKKISLTELNDVCMLTIVTDEIDDCYRILGVVHQLYKPSHEGFFDYIAIPKANGYRSLHTQLLGPQGLSLDLCIRTRSMNEHAHLGIISECQRILSEKKSDIHDELQAQSWFKNILDLKMKTDNSLEFIENFKMDLVKEEIYAFTPQGEIVKLPMGATPIDFAYAIHSNIGHRCVASKVDQKLVPLNTPIKSGQRVEIITSPTAHSHVAWLDCVVTARARTHIRHYLKQLKKEDAVKLGKQLLEEYLKPYNLTYSQISQEILQELLKRLSLHHLETLFESMASGHSTPALIAAQLAGAQPQGSLPPVVLQGNEGAAVTYASCCLPVLGDAIVAYIEPHEGLVVHRSSCSLLTAIFSKKQPVQAMWSVKAEHSFLTRVELSVKNKRGVLGQIASALASLDVDIQNIKVVYDDGLDAVLDLLLKVRDAHQLKEVLRQLKMIKVVSRAERSNQ